MENKLIRNHNSIPTCIPNSLGMHKNSHTISKTKPRIRIIHIFAPEIIKTDVENFRELVQQLTGKPQSGEEKKFNCQKKKKKKARVEEESRSSSSGSSGISSSKVKNGEFFGLDLIRERVIKEEIGGVISSSTDESTTTYLGGFSDLEGFIAAEIGGFPLLPLDGTHLQGFV